MEVIISAIIGATATLITFYLNKKIQCRTKEKCPLVEHAEKNDNVYKVLDFCISSLSGDRAYIYEFHNGEVYYSGSSQQKFSCTYEVAEEGISRECNNIQNFRISNFHSLIQEVVKDGSFSFGDIEKISDPVVKAHFIKKGTKSACMLPVKTLSGKIVGIIGVDHVKKSTEFKPGELEEVKKSALLVGGYL